MYRSYLLQSLETAEHMREVQARCQRNLMIKLAKPQDEMVKNDKQPGTRSRLGVITHFLAAAFAR